MKPRRGGGVEKREGQGECMYLCMAHAIIERIESLFSPKMWNMNVQEIFLLHRIQIIAKHSSKCNRVGLSLHSRLYISRNSIGIGYQRQSYNSMILRKIVELSISCSICVLKISIF